MSFRRLLTLVGASVLGIYFAFCETNTVEGIQAPTAETATLEEVVQAESNPKKGLQKHSARNAKSQDSSEFYSAWHSSTMDFLKNGYGRALVKEIYKREGDTCTIYSEGDIKILGDQISGLYKQFGFEIAKIVYEEIYNETSNQIGIHKHEICRRFYTRRSLSWLTESFTPTERWEILFAGISQIELLPYEAELARDLLAQMDEDERKVYIEELCGDKEYLFIKPYRVDDFPDIYSGSTGNKVKSNDSKNILCRSILTEFPDDFYETISYTQGNPNHPLQLAFEYREQDHEFFNIIHSESQGDKETMLIEWEGRQDDLLQRIGRTVCKAYCGSSKDTSNIYDYVFLFRANLRDLDIIIDPRSLFSSNPFSTEIERCPGSH